jgi:hypothetical protein
MVRGKRTAADVFDNAETSGLEKLDVSDINGDPVYRELEPGTQINYSRMLDLWDE